MAQTAYGVNANEAVKLWSRKLMREQGIRMMTSAVVPAITEVS